MSNKWFKLLVCFRSSPSHNHSDFQDLLYSPGNHILDLSVCEFFYSFLLLYFCMWITHLFCMWIPHYFMLLIQSLWAVDWSIPFGTCYISYWCLTHKLTVTYIKENKVHIGLGFLGSHPRRAVAKIELNLRTEKTLLGWLPRNS